MRYTIRDPFEYETGDAAAGMPPTTPAPADAAAAGTAPADALAPDTPTADTMTADTMTADTVPVETAPVQPAGGVAAGPPLWSTADGHVLHLPPRVVAQVPILRYVRSPLWARRRRLARRGLSLRPWVRLRRQATIDAVGRLVRAARQLRARRPLAGAPPIFHARLAGRPFRILTRPGRGLRHEILSIEPELGEIEGQLATGAPPAPIAARILWPALGFPAVVSPSERPSPATTSEGDATTCVCVLIACNRQKLSSEDAARHLRCVPWAQRGRRHIAARSFKASDLSVRSDVGSRSDHAGGTQGRVRRAHPVRRQCAAAERGRRAAGGESAQLLPQRRPRSSARDPTEPGGNRTAAARPAPPVLEQPGTSEAAPSDEMKLLVDRFARPRRAGLGRQWQSQQGFLTSEYMFEYRYLHAPYNTPLRGQKPVAAEILHPLFVWPRTVEPLRIGHVTDTHVDVRADVYEHNLTGARRAASRTPGHVLLTHGDYNNFNRSFAKVYDDAKKTSDILLMTGDLVDYGRGFWGLGRATQVQDDSAYHADRNWFLFYDLIAAGGTYTTPSYTILGNHDWRLNPYPPFAPGAPNPNELLHDHLQLTPAQQRKIIELAHGAGHKRAFSYAVKAESTWQLLRERTGSAFKALVQLFGQTSNLEQRGFPTETTDESIAWYLFSINPFLDYTFTLPRKQSVLMLDWAKDELVLFPQVRNGERSGYNPLSPGDAAGTPKPRNSPTPLQQKLVAEFLGGPSRSKVIGVHAPPIGPYADWYRADLAAGRKTYADPAAARGPKAGHPLFAVMPSRHVITPYGMVADRGSLGNEQGREWFIKRVNDPKYFVRLVLSGHIHRSEMYMVERQSQPIEVVNPKDPSRRVRVSDALLVSTPSKRRQGPLYITTTSAGPRGSFEQRPLTAAERGRGGMTTSPGYTRLELAGDGTVKGLFFSGAQPPPAARQRPAPVRREIAVGV